MAGRPLGFDRDAALAVAVEQFSREGFAGTSIATLTQAMGITPPSLYTAFGDKRRLFEEAARIYYQRTCEGLDRAVERPTAHEAIAKILTDSARAHTDTATPPGCLTLTEPRLAGQRADLQRRIKDRLDRGVRDGDLPPNTPTEMNALFLVAVLRGMSSAARDGNTYKDLLAIGAAAMAVLPSPSAGQNRDRRADPSPSGSGETAERLPRVQRSPE